MTGNRDFKDEKEGEPQRQQDRAFEGRFRILSEQSLKQSQEPGDEHDETEAEEPELVRLDSGRVQVSGRFDLDDLNDELGLALPEDEEYDTIAGFVLAKLGHVPNAGESLEVDGITFTALAATPTHIELIAIDLPLDAA